MLKEFAQLLLIFMLCAAVGYGQLNSQQLEVIHQPFAYTWYEQINLPFQRSEQLYLYKINDFVDDEVISTLGNAGYFLILVDLHFHPYGSSDDQMVLFNSLGNYIRALRINLAYVYDLEFAWTSREGLIEPSLVLSIWSEMRVVKLLAERMLDVAILDAEDSTREYQELLFTRFHHAFRNVSSLFSQLEADADNFCTMEPDDRRDFFHNNLWSDMVQKAFFLTDDLVTLTDHIDNLIVEPFLFYYQDYSLAPYFSTRFCDDVVRNRSLHSYDVIANMSIRFPGSDKWDGLYTLSSLLPIEWSWEEDLKWARKFLHIDDAFVHHSDTKCEVQVRTMYSLVGYNATRLHEAQNPQGAGALTQRRFLRCVNSGQELHLPYGPVMLSLYNTLVMVGALPVVSPSRIDKVKVLSVGLGGGEMHTALLAFFENMEVYSIDVCKEIVEMAWEDFFLKHQTCAVMELKDGGLHPYSPLHEQAVHGHLNSSIHLLSSDNVDSCRSQIIIGDMIDLVDILLLPDPPRAVPKQFDIVIFDAFVAAANSWNGTLFQGVSNVEKGFARGNIEKVREVLTENGMAIFHLHKDSLFVDYVPTIMSVFGPDNVVHLDTSTIESIIVTKKNGKFFTNHHQYVSNEQCKQGEHDLNSASCETLAAEAETSFLGHPCQSPETFIKYVDAFAQAVDYPILMKSAAFQSLNCTEYQSKEQLP